MTLLSRSLSRLLACICLLSCFAPAQTSAPKKIVFTGVPKYAQADLLAMSGLHANVPLTAADISTGARNLGESGFFSNVQYTFDNVTLTYKLQPAAEKDFLPAHYENLVWWSSDELTAELHRRHPLFTGMVPQNGTMQTALLADLTAMLAEKGVTATVDAIPAASHATAIDYVGFTITSPPVHIHALQVDIAPELAPKLAGVRDAFAGQDFNATTTPSSVAEALSNAIQDEGYLDVTLDHYQHGAPLVTASHIDVDISISAHPGERYRIANINWPGSPSLSVEDFAKISLLKKGDIPSTANWRRTRSALAQAYGDMGYMAAKTNVQPELDHTAHLVSYNITVTPGAQYNFHTLMLDGVTDAQRAEVMKTWKMQPGSIYNASYVKTFLLKNSGGLRSLAGYSEKYTQTIDDDHRLVDLHVTMVKGGALQ